MGRRSHPVLLAVVATLLVAAAVWWLAGGGARGPSATDAADAERAAGDAPADAEADLSARARDESLRLRAFPGVRLTAGGNGVVTGAVHVLLAGAEEKPLSGVEIELACVDGGRELRVPGVTDEAGAFALAPVPARVGWVLRARHAPHRDLFVRAIAVRDGLTTDVGTLVFGSKTTLLGRVTDARGRPLGGALVSVERDGARGAGVDLGRLLRDLARSPGPLLEGRADADGRFALAGLPPGRYVVRATYPGHASAFVSGVVVTADGESSEVRVVLDPGAGFEGRVADEEGRGLEGARVVAVEVLREPRDSMDRQETRADRDGRFRLDTLTSGATWFVEAHRDGFAPSGRVVRTEAERISPLDFVLVAGGRVEGRVTEARTGAPVPAAEVLVVTGMVGTGTAPVATVAGEDGRYALENVIPGPVILVEVRAPGRAPGGFGYDARTARTVKSGETLVIDVPLSDGGRVLGTVRTADGRPVPWASVAAGRGDRFSGESATLTDARGEYRLPGLRPGGWILVVTAPGWASPVEDADVKVAVEEGRDVVRDVVLASGAVVSGLVRSPDGSGVPGARVAVLPKDARRYGARVRDLAAVSDAAGGYRVVGVPPGLEVVVEADHDAWVASRSDAFRAGPGESRTVDVVMRPGARILGRAVDAAGRPVRGARVRTGAVAAEDRGRLGDSFRADALLSPRVFVTDDLGAFACDHARPGPVLLKVEADGYAAWYRRDLAVPDEGDLVGVTATLEGAATVRGRVVSADAGRPIRGAWVYATARDADGAPKDDGRVKALVSVETGADGVYALEKVPPGLVDVVVWFAAGHVTAWNDPTCRREAVPAGASGIDFRLVPVPAAEPGGR